jgi:hypothetical protein
MKRFLFGFLFVVFASNTQAQQSETHFFAQCMLNIDNQTEFDQLTADLQANPYVKIVRLDWYSKRLFLLTKDITSFNLEIFNSWLGDEVSKASCIQVGLHGTDVVNPYPFVNCPN